MGAGPYYRECNIQVNPSPEVLINTTDDTSMPLELQQSLTP